MIQTSSYFEDVNRVQIGVCIEALNSPNSGSLTSVLEESERSQPEGLFSL